MLNCVDISPHCLYCCTVSLSSSLSLLLFSEHNLNVYLCCCTVKLSSLFIFYVVQCKCPQAISLLLYCVPILLSISFVLWPYAHSLSLLIFVLLLSRFIFTAVLWSYPLQLYCVAIIPLFLCCCYVSLSSLSISNTVQLTFPQGLSQMLWGEPISPPPHFPFCFTLKISSLFIFTSVQFSYPPSLSILLYCKPILNLYLYWCIEQLLPCLYLLLYCFPILPLYLYCFTVNLSSMFSSTAVAYPPFFLLLYRVAVLPSISIGILLPLNFDCCTV